MESTETEMLERVELPHLATVGRRRQNSGRMRHLRLMNVISETELRMVEVLARRATEVRVSRG